jgi:hypothetical protein
MNLKTFKAAARTRKLPFWAIISQIRQLIQSQAKMAYGRAASKPVASWS